MNRSFAPLLAVVALAALAAWYGFRIESTLRREIAELRSRLAEFPELESRNAAWRALAPDPEELRRLEARRIALLRLKGEIGELRQLAGPSTHALAAQLAVVRSEAEEAREQTRRLGDRIAARDRSRATRQALDQCEYLIQEAARRAEGRIPASWDEVRRLLAGPWVPYRSDRPDPPDTGERLRAMILESFDAATRESIPPATFEILPVPQPRGRPTPGQSPPRVLLLRERQARENPDGGWTRAYRFLDGPVEEVSSVDGDFSAWERSATAPPAAPAPRSP